MFTPFLSPEDRPPVELGQVDRFLQRQLQEAVTKRFYEACDGVTQALLTCCDWQITAGKDVLTLMIQCPDMMTNWRVLNNVVSLGNTLQQFVPSAKIRICPPPETGTPFEIRVDEISVYRDLM
ncbi:hypothetical protein OsccyDRAFT_1338 [Leptolyngbyaceae cyanobacterium JSC-12]|nr:hypothetical protein OsccyDRAFT_1338 [Leptolyngbyaceae cyanobacterium JSC-12]